MAKFPIILCLLLSYSLHASSGKFASLIQQAVEFEHEGKISEAKSAYVAAWNLKVDQDKKLPVLVELVRLHRDDKKNGLHWVIETEKWLGAHPEEKEMLGPWIKTMRGYVTGSMNTDAAPAFMKTWAIDQKLPALIKEKKYEEAWSLVKSRDLSEADLRSKVIHDVLAAVWVKNKSRTNYCEDSLKRHPSSYAWTIRVCRYLESWKNNKKDKVYLKSIASQIRDEEPKSSFLLTALEEL